MSSSSSTHNIITHGHDLHVIIPTTNSSRVPSASATKGSTPLDTLGHGHTLLVLPHPAGTVVPLDDGSGDDGHGHTGLFRVLDDDDGSGDDGHGHTGLFRILDDDDGSDGHGHTGTFRGLDDGSNTHGHHGLFRADTAGLDQNLNAPLSPTSPKPSVRVARRNSLFMSISSEGCMHEEHENARSTVLPPTAETYEPFGAELDGSFKAQSGGEARQGALAKA